MKSISIRSTGLLLVCLCANHSIISQQVKWSTGTDPELTGRKLVQHFIETPHTNFGNPGLPGSLTYPESCTWFGALRFCAATGDTVAQLALEKRWLKLVNEESKLIPRPDHVDNNVFGTVPFELFLLYRKQEYLQAALPFSDKQWALPSNAGPKGRALQAQGFSWQTRFWIDDMFMISAVQAAAFRATKDTQYIDRAAKQMVLYLDSLQRPNGLFYHAPDVPFFWGRGNGWMAAGMTELLRSLPEQNADRKRILKAYRTMMKNLKKYQSAEGMWNQLVDDPQSWAESSCTAMFTYAMVTGVKKGWLTKKQYLPVARKAWEALVKRIDDNGDVRDVCEGTNKKNDRQFYLNRKRLTGDLHGQAPLIWSAWAWIE